MEFSGNNIVKIFWINSISMIIIVIMKTVSDRIETLIISSKTYSYFNVIKIILLWYG